jgi:hypothetical protein
MEQERRKMETYMPVSIKECPVLKGRYHSIIYLELEPSIYKNGICPEPYCKYCFKTLEQIYMEWDEYLRDIRICYPDRIGGNSSAR